MLYDYKQTEKLFEMSGPALRLRIATELMDKFPCDFEELVQKVLELPEVQKYIEYYASGSSQRSSCNYSKMLHGGTSDKLENIAGKLWSLGIRKGVSSLDNFLKPYINIMEQDFFGKKCKPCWLRNLLSIPVFELSRICK